MGLNGRGKYLGMEIGGTKGQLAGGGVAKMGRPFLEESVSIQRNIHLP